MCSYSTNFNSFAAWLTTIFSTGWCPPSHPYFYNSNGGYCCASTDNANEWREGCDPSGTGRCCHGDDYIICPIGEECSDFKGIVSCEKVDHVSPTLRFCMDKFGRLKLIKK